MPLVCPWGAKAQRQGQPRAAKGRLLRQIAVKIHVFFICIFGFSGFRVFGFSGFRVFGFSGFQVFRFSGSDSGQGPCKVHDSGLTGSESGHVVLALVVPLDTPWLPLVCPWGTKAHRHGQPRAAKGRLLSALDRRNTHLLPRLHVLLIHFQVSRISGFRAFRF